MRVKKGEFLLDVNACRDKVSSIAQVADLVASKVFILGLSRIDEYAGSVPISPDSRPENVAMGIGKRPNNASNCSV